MIHKFREHMPLGYIKRVKDALQIRVADSSITQEIKHLGMHKEITEAISWVGMENILGKMLQMPNR